MTSKILRIATLALLVLTCVLSAVAQEGAVTLGRNLDELTTQAQTIVRGQVLSAVVEPHPQYTNLKTVVVSVRVDQALKGAVAGKTLTFRQFIWDYRDIINAEGYRKGQQVLLLLNAPTELGLTSTAGLGQGRFRITRGADGVEYAVNDRGNRNLMHGMTTSLSARGVKLAADLDMLVQRPPAGPIRADQLQALITKIVGGN